MSEISGVVKNALERGWNISEVKQSLINAGYTPQEVEIEVTVPQGYSFKSPITQPSSAYPSLKGYQTPSVGQPKNKKRILIGLAILITLVFGASLYFIFKYFK